MRILHIHTTMSSGGIEAVVCGLVNEMSKDHDVTLCTIFEPKETDVFYKRLESSVKKVSLGKTQKGFSINELIKIFELIKKGDFDVVHIHGCFQYYFLSILLMPNKAKYFYTIHTSAEKESVSWDKYLIGLKRFFFKKNIIRPITISCESQKAFRDFFKCDSVMIKNGIPKPLITIKESLIEKYKYTNKTKVYVHPGRITEAKNQVVLCKVFQRIIEEGRDVVLLICGTAEDMNIYNEMQSYFSDRIIYIGEQNNVPTLLYQCDAMCLPSIWEGLPITLLEALSVGCVPICSPVGGIRDVVKSGVNGILSISSSEEDYYNAVMSFEQMSSEDVASIKVNCINSFEEYGINKTAELYLSEYKK